MVKDAELKKYLEDLPKNMTLKKKVVKFIMKSKEPLTQKKIKKELNQKDWTNLRRVLRDLTDEGVVVKKRIGLVDYYVKVDIHGKSDVFQEGEIYYFIDLFEPDFKDEEKYIRIKQAIKEDKDKFGAIGKITIKQSQFSRFINKLNDVNKKLKS